MYYCRNLEETDFKEFCDESVAVASDADEWPHLKEKLDKWFFFQKNNGNAPERAPSFALPKPHFFNESAMQTQLALSVGLNLSNLQLQSLFNFVKLFGQWRFFTLSLKLLRLTKLCGGPQAALGLQFAMSASSVPEFSQKGEHQRPGIFCVYVQGLVARFS